MQRTFRIGQSARHRGFSLDWYPVDVPGRIESGELTAAAHCFLEGHLSAHMLQCLVSTIRLPGKQIAARLSYGLFQSFDLFIAHG